MTAVLIVYFFDEERSLNPALEILPFCLFTAIVFLIPFWLSLYFWGVEFPSLMGPMVGGFITIVTLKRGYLLPDSKWEFPPREDWSDHWVGDMEPGSNQTSIENGQRMPLWKAWVPYIVLTIFLVITRVFDSIADFLTTTLVIEWSDIFGTTISNDVAVLYLPGTWLLASALIAIAMYRMEKDEVGTALQETVEKLARPAITIMTIVALVEIMLQSGAYSEGVDSMVVTIAEPTAAVSGAFFPFISTSIGALGAFVFGSNTVSNLTFSAFQFTAANELGISRAVIVGAQDVGGAVGNLIAIQNVVAALATVGLVGEEGRVIRLTIIPFIYYCIMAGVLIMLFVYVLVPTF